MRGSTVPAGFAPRARERTSCLLCGTDDPSPFRSSRVHLAPGGAEVFHFVRCSSCDLVYLNPRPTRSAMGGFYPPGYPPHRGPAAWGRWKSLVELSERALDRKRVRRLLSLVDLSPEDTVVDVGCGRPTFLQALRSRVRARLVGMDPTDEGWRGSSGLRTGLDLLEGTFPELEIAIRTKAPHGFRAATLWHALEHDPSPRVTLRSLRRLAAPGARLLVEVPDLSSPAAQLQGEDWGGLHTPRHTVLYTPETLARTLASAGWTVEGIHRYGTLHPYTLWWLGRQVRKGRALDGPLERHFPGFVAGRILWSPLTSLQRWLPLGVQSAVARAEPRDDSG